MSTMGTPENGFRKQKVEHHKRPQMTIREAVAKWGDNWRLLFPDNRFVHREHMERNSAADWDAQDMVELERGAKSRIRVDDIR